MGICTSSNKALTNNSTNETLRNKEVKNTKIEDEDNAKSPASLSTLEASLLKAENRVFKIPSDSLEARAIRRRSSVTHNN